MDPKITVAWIIGRYYNEFDKKEYCAMITPNYNEQLSGKIDTKYIALEERIKGAYSVTDIEEINSITLEKNIKKAIMLCRNSDGVYGQRYLINIEESVIQRIECILSSVLLNFNMHKWFLGSYIDDKRDHIYIFSIQDRGNFSNNNNNNLNCMYNDKNIFRIKEYPSLKDKDYLDKISRDASRNHDNNENTIDKYVASTLAILNKWKIRLFDIEKYQMIWILDKYNKQEEKGYCIIPTDEEIQKNTVIDKNEDRVRIINRYDPKICKIIHKHGLKLDTVEKREKFNIPYRTLGRFEDEICILNVKGNEIYWTIDDPVYRQNNVIFYTHDSDTFSNLLRLPIRKRDDNRYLSCFKYCKEKGMRLKLNPVVLESRILHCLKDFSLNITREAINLQGGGVRVSGEF